MSDRLGREDWLDAGLAQLAASGPDGLRVTAIAQRLGVTKGSFYWHFRDQAEYLAALLQAWENSHTQQIIEHVESIGGTPLARLRNLLSITLSADARLARAVRAWAQRDPLAGKALKRVDHRRLAYAAGLLCELGWSADDALTLARWSYCALIGHLGLGGPALNDRQVDLILGTLAFPAARPDAARG